MSKKSCRRDDADAFERVVGSGTHGSNSARCPLMVARSWGILLYPAF